MTPQEIETLRVEALKDKVEALSDMVEILKAERDVLAAQLDVLRTAALNAISFMSGGTAKAELRDAYDATPQQCLRDVQAEAGRLGFIAGACRWVAEVHPDYAADVAPDIEADADKYAESVQQGGAA